MQRNPIDSRIILGRPRLSIALACRRARHALVLVACLALLGHAMARTVGAADQDPGGAGQANVQICEAAGGDALVDVDRYPDGALIVVVYCDGGYLDGWECEHDNGATWNCRTTIIIPGDGGVGPIGGGPIVDNPDVGDGGDDGGAAPDGGGPVVDNPDAADDASNQGDAPRPSKHGKHHQHGGKHHRHGKR